MAAEGPLKELCEEATCSICLDFFRDPVILTECGHNFCHTCLTRSWGESGAKLSCPQCRGIAQPKSLRPNQQLANFVEILQKLNPLEGKGEDGEKRFSKEDETPLYALCGRSQEEATGERMADGVARKARVCQKHQEPLKLFCKDDEALICVVCDRSKEHRNHETLPLEEASQEYKDHFCNTVEILRKEREKLLLHKVIIMKESEDLIKQTKGERQKTVSQFRELHMFLEEQEELLLAQVEEVEKEVAKKRDGHLAKLSEELSSVESLIQEMEEKCEQPARDLLQDARSTLQKYEKKAFENPAVFPLALKWRIWDFSELNLILEDIRKQFKDNLGSGLHLQKAKVTLDPDTAHAQLILSDGQKSMRLGEKTQALPNNPERFDQSSAVLGCEGFTAGCHFWEVFVGSEERWVVGVARKSVRRKDPLALIPEEGIWGVGKWEGSYRASVKKGHYPVLTVKGELKRIRVCLNCAGGQVAFFDADRAALLYEYSAASISGVTLLPFFWVYGKGHLKIS